MSLQSYRYLKRSISDHQTKFFYLVIKIDWIIRTEKISSRKKYSFISNWKYWALVFCKHPIFDSTKRFFAIRGSALYTQNRHVLSRGGYSQRFICYQSQWTNKNVPLLTNQRPNCGNTTDRQIYWLRDQYLKTRLRPRLEAIEVSLTRPRIATL